MHELKSELLPKKYFKEASSIDMTYLDTQASLSYLLQHKNIDLSKSLHKVIASDCEITISKVIQSTKYKNIDIIVGGESLRKTLPIMREIYDNKNWYLVGLQVYKKNIDIFDAYDYVLIDYPPTTDDLSLNWLIFSDLIIIPTNCDSTSFKGILDLNNSLELIITELKRSKPLLKIVFNNINDNDNRTKIKSWLNKYDFSNLLSHVEIKTSEIFTTSNNNFISIWENPYYWRQKQAYEELIAEIL
ncbi:MAG: ParA family protein [Spiroplasma ixodetis]|nr:ParA family protein [Spiroplasma ixodetis]MBP1526464.1 ParA family protein [Spiroplasma ixodetis]MBP1527710.1 ParA family protein [Spiroplasma ixodetis]